MCHATPLWFVHKTRERRTLECGTGLYFEACYTYFYFQGYQKYFNAVIGYFLLLCSLILITAELTGCLSKGYPFLKDAEMLLLQRCKI